MSAPAPDRDARILSRLRAWWADNAATVRAIPGYRVPVEVDEFELLLRQADENTELRRALCEEHGSARNTTQPTNHMNGDER